MGQASRTLSFVLGFSVLAIGIGHAQGNGVALERDVSDAERGVRATITYDPYALDAGQEEVVNSDGSVSTLSWHVILGQFTAEITEGSLAGTDAEAFLREAVVAVCPSVDDTALGRELVRVQGPFLSIFAQCPAIDATLN
ncbi:hypothetical protein A8B78_15565 [Jannaschia sp. EhC01]|nr:hypothetical protein A8B78_15565 [Jannaschia sp. EhC01]